MPLELVWDQQVNWINQTYLINLFTPSFGVHVKIVKVRDLLKIYPIFIDSE